MTDKTIDCTFTAQMLFFFLLSRITTEFEVYEELVGLASIQGQTKGSDFHHSLQKHLQAQYLDLCKLVDLSNYQVFSTAGAQNSTIFPFVF